MPGFEWFSKIFAFLWFGQNKQIYMFMVVIYEYIMISFEKMDAPKILQLPIFGSQFLNPG